MTPLILPRGPHQLSAALHAPASRPASPRATPLVILAHGFTGNKCENGRLFTRTARALADAGIAALRFDFMGSGDSSGDFADMTPNTECDDLEAVIRWARRRHDRIGVLGLSMGGGVAICTLARLPAGTVSALCTWSSVPSFRRWRAEKDPNLLDRRNVNRVGRRFFSDRPVPDVPEAYTTLTLPKLQIQGDGDLPGFLTEFAAYFPDAPEPKRHLVIPGADHVFTAEPDRARVIRETVRFFSRHLSPVEARGPSPRRNATAAPRGVRNPRR